MSEDRQGDRQQGTYTGIDIRKTSLKMDRQRAKIPHRDLSKERERERKRGKEQEQRSE